MSKPAKRKPQKPAGIPITELGARWVSHGGEGYKDAQGNPIPLRERVGVVLDRCPCGTCEHALYVPFKNPVDGLGPVPETRGWERTGDTLETLTLKPSIRRLSGCKWHGFITDGEARSV